MSLLLFFLWNPYFKTVGTSLIILFYLKDSQQYSMEINFLTIPSKVYGTDVRNLDLNCFWNISHSKIFKFANLFFTVVAEQLENFQTIGIIKLKTLFWEICTWGIGNNQYLFANDLLKPKVKYLILSLFRAN